MVEDRIFSKVLPTGFCWLWQGSVTTRGYGQCGYKKRVLKAHRLIYEILVGPIPKGLELDHLCRIKRCVNPDHLEPVTKRENLRRHAQSRGWEFLDDGEERPKSPTRIRSELGVCKRGHVLAEVGLYTFKGKRGPRSSCGACRQNTVCRSNHHKLGCTPNCPLQTYPR
jgi:hypothetical protein